MPSTQAFYKLIEKQFYNKDWKSFQYEKINFVPFITFSLNCGWKSRMSLELLHISFFIQIPTKINNKTLQLCKWAQRILSRQQFYIEAKICILQHSSTVLVNQQRNILHCGKDETSDSFTKSFLLCAVYSQHITKQKKIMFFF